MAKKKMLKKRLRKRKRVKGRRNPEKRKCEENGYLHQGSRVGGT